MRQITNDSINAFMNRSTFNKANMSVTTNFEVFYLRLHGNIIAELYKDGKLKITNCGWQSNTTKERLNALKGVNISQKNFIWYLNEKEWDGELIEITQ